MRQAPFAIIGLVVFMCALFSEQVQGTVYFESNFYSWGGANAYPLYSMAFDDSGTWNWMTGRIVGDTPAAPGQDQWKAYDSSGGSWYGKNSAPGYNGPQFTDMNTSDGDSFKYQDVRDSYVIQFGDKGGTKYGTYKEYVVNLTGDFNSWSLVVDTMSVYQRGASGDTWKIEVRIDNNTTDTTFKFTVGDTWNPYAFGEYENAAVQQTLPVTSDADKIAGSGYNIWVNFPAADTYAFFLWYDHNEGKSYYSVNRKLNLFQVSAPGTIYQNRGFTMTVTAIDYMNNTYTTYDGTAGCTDASLSISPTTLSSFSSGVKTITATITKSGTTTITVFDDIEVGTVTVFINPPPVKINEIVSNDDKNPDVSEWVELYNAETFSVDMTGWTITAYNGSESYTFGSITLPSKNYILLYSSDTSVGTDETDFSDSYARLFTKGLPPSDFVDTYDELGL